MERSGADVIIRTMMEELRMTRPEKPAEFMVQFLQRNYIGRPKMRTLHEIDHDEEDQMALEEEEELSSEFSSELSSPEFERPNVYIVVPDSLKRKRRGMFSILQPIFLLPIFTLSHIRYSLSHSYRTYSLVISNFTHAFTQHGNTHDVLPYYSSPQAQEQYAVMCPA